MHGAAGPGRQPAARRRPGSAPAGAARTAEISRCGCQRRCIGADKCRGRGHVALAAAAGPGGRQQPERRALERSRWSCRTHPGIADYEIALASRRLGAWIYSLEGQLRSLDGIARARADRTKRRLQCRCWLGFPDKPPYSILRAEELAHQVDALKARVEAAGATQAVSAREFDQLQKDVPAGRRAKRRAEGRCAPPGRCRCRVARPRSRLGGQRRGRHHCSDRARPQVTEARAEVDKAALAAAGAAIANGEGPHDLHRGRPATGWPRASRRARRGSTRAAAAQAAADLRTREAAAAERALQALLGWPCRQPRRPG